MVVLCMTAGCPLRDWAVSEMSSLGREKRGSCSWTRGLFPASTPDIGRGMGGDGAWSGSDSDD